MQLIDLIFKAVLFSSILGSFVALMILLIKKLFKNKLSASWHYYIWFLLILRLGIPYSFESSLSIFNVFPQPINTVQTTLNTRNNLENIGILKHSMNSVPQNFTSTEPTISKLSASTSNFDMFKLAGITWFTITILLLLFIIFIYISNNNKIKNQQFCNDEALLSLFDSCKKITNIKKHIPISYSTDIQGTSLYGLFKPRIIISKDLFNKLLDEEKKYILLHELVHLKQKDIFINWITIILSLLNWFNPLILYSFHKMKQDCEFSCDEKVMTYLGPDYYKNYGNTIITAAALFSNPSNVINSTAFTSSKINLKRRIAMIRSYKGRSLKLSIMGITLIILLGFIFLVNPKVINKQPDTDTKTTANATKTVEMFKALSLPDILNINLFPIRIYQRTQGQRYDLKLSDSYQLEIAKTIISYLNDCKTSKESIPIINQHNANLTITLNDFTKILITPVVEYGKPIFSFPGSEFTPTTFHPDLIYVTVIKPNSNEQPVNVILTVSSKLPGLIGGGY
ncbi:M56 family metallopeptidase [Clostridium zeae]|nr:M56 family metallopeptidase [Clostridium zeae]